MVAFPNMTRVHPTTIYRHSRGDDLMARSRLRLVRDDGPSLAVHSLKVHPLVWAEAMRLADGDGRRIRIDSENCVTVHNSPPASPFRPDA
jgi:hypothetical protein